VYEYRGRGAGALVSKKNLWQLTKALSMEASMQPTGSQHHRQRTLLLLDVPVSAPLVSSHVSLSLILVQVR
jgi:hypothetical protein